MGTQTGALRVAARPSDLVGGTPLLDLTSYLTAHGVTNGSKLYAKMESLGPCSSVKDRLGRSMIDEAEKQGLITPGKTVLVEPTSGNTGIALAFIGRERGYRYVYFFCLIVVFGKLLTTEGTHRRLVLPVVFSSIPAIISDAF